VGGAAAAGGGIFSKAGLSGFLPGLKSFFGFGEKDWTNMGGGRMATGGWISQYGSLGDKLTALGKSNAAMLGGGMLALNGLQRGGLLGMGEDVAGGALLGFKFGGGLGAAIGAAAGLAAGAIRMLFESPEQEAKRLIKQLYQVDIDTAMAKQIADIAKQKYAGHVSIAVRDPDVRKMIELYAAGTGQHMPLSATTPHGASILEQGGKLYQAPTYLYGNPYTFQSSLPTAGGFATGQYPTSGPMTLQVNVQGQGAAQFVAGQVVTPEFVQSQWSSAANGSNGRLSNSALIQQPGLVVA
jgi:hypothetical protein